MTPPGCIVIIYVTYAMRRPPKLPPDAKTQALREAGALHPHPEAVRDDAFVSHPFFDPRDRVQVKYEMLRRHQVDGRPVTEVAARFGVSIISRVEGRRVTSRESVALPALSHRAAVRVPWARFLPPLSEPGVPISGTGLSSGIMRLAHGLSSCDQRAGLASRGTRLTPWRWPAGASSDLLTP